MTATQAARLSSEIAVLTPAQAESVAVPFAPGFDLEALKAVDDDPFFVTVSIKPGRGDQGAGPLYDEALLRSLDEQFKAKRPPGYKGHQDPEKTSWEYREAVTAWIGSTLAEDAEGQTRLYVKGYVPKTAKDLRTQLRLAESGADVVNSVSIFGVREVVGDKVETFDLWSLDWTPKGRAGMETELVGVSGETSTEENDMATREEVIASLQLKEVPEALANALRAEGADAVAGEVTLAGEMRVIFELEAEADSSAMIEAVKSLVAGSKSATLSAAIDEALEGSEVKAEMALAAVHAYVLRTAKPEATKEELVGEIAKALEVPYIKELVGEVAKTENPTVQGGGSGKAADRLATAWA